VSQGNGNVVGGGGGGSMKVVHFDKKRSVPRENFGQRLKNSGEKKGRKRKKIPLV